MKRRIESEIEKEKRRRDHHPLKPASQNRFPLLNGIFRYTEQDAGQNPHKDAEIAPEMLAAVKGASRDTGEIPVNKKEHRSGDPYEYDKGHSRKLPVFYAMGNPGSNKTDVPGDEKSDNRPHEGKPVEAEKPVEHLAAGE
ncbi:MAG: hypothetical protein JXA20_17290 [Spirochaetes bacterium]|nr:hypothetical protein [Spirochaetota bacterium]